MKVNVIRTDGTVVEPEKAFKIDFSVLGSIKDPNTKRELVYNTIDSIVRKFMSRFGITTDAFLATVITNCILVYGFDLESSKDRESILQVMKYNIQNHLFTISDKAFNCSEELYELVCQIIR